MGELIKVAEAAKILKCSKFTIWSLIRTGKIPSYRLGPKLIKLYLVDIYFLRDEIKKVKKEFPNRNLNYQKPSYIAQRLQFPSVRVSP